MAPNPRQSADAFARKSLVFMKFISCSIVKVWIPTHVPPELTGKLFRSLPRQTPATIEAIL